MYIDALGSEFFIPLFVDVIFVVEHWIANIKYIANIVFWLSDNGALLPVKGYLMTFRTTENM